MHVQASGFIQQNTTSHQLDNHHPQNHIRTTRDIDCQNLTINKPISNFKNPQSKQQELTSKDDSTSYMPRVPKFAVNMRHETLCTFLVRQQPSNRKYVLSVPSHLLSSLPHIRYLQSPSSGLRSSSSPTYTHPSICYQNTKLPLTLHNMRVDAILAKIGHLLPATGYRRRPVKQLIDSIEDHGMTQRPLSTRTSSIIRTHFQLQYVASPISPATSANRCGVQSWSTRAAASSRADFRHSSSIRWYPRSASLYSYREGNVRRSQRTP